MWTSGTMMPILRRQKHSERKQKKVETYKNLFSQLNKIYIYCEKEESDDLPLQPLRSSRLSPAATNLLSRVNVKTKRIGLFFSFFLSSLPTPAYSCTRLSILISVLCCCCCVFVDHTGRKLGVSGPVLDEDNEKPQNEKLSFRPVQL